MSQCKRSCVISFTSNNCFTYVFGDIDPNNPKYVKSLLVLLNTYSKSKEGFQEEEIDLNCLNQIY